MKRPIFCLRPSATMLRPTHVIRILSFAISLLLLVSGLHAQTIANPGFETGDLTGWTATGTVSVVAAGPVADNGTIPQGSKVAALQTVSQSVFQSTITTTITDLIQGSQYVLSYRVNTSLGGAVFVSAKLAGTNLGDTTMQSPVEGTNPYSTRTAFFTAASATATLEVIAAGNQTTALLVDDFKIFKKNPIVANTLDSGPGSLRQALLDAAASPGADTITFAPALSGQTISLTSHSASSFGETGIIINDSGGVTIDATGLQGGITIDDGAATTYRLFLLAEGSNVTFRGLTFANGGGTSFGLSGGAIAALLNTTTTLERCTLTGNKVRGVTPGGGAIMSTGTLELTHCTLSGNDAINTHTTGFSLGGAIAGGTMVDGGSSRLTHCTLSLNSATGTGSGGRGGAISGDVVLKNCIVAGNSATVAGTENISGTVLSGSSDNLTSGSPLLGPLADNGGPTKTMALLPGSPALDAGAVIGFATDQRGLARIVDGDGIGGGAPDIGAVEYQRVVVTTATDELNTPSTGGAGISLREAIRDGADLIVFGPAFNGSPTIMLSAALGEIVLAKSGVTIDASTIPAGITVNGASQNFRLFSVPAGKTVAMHNMKLTNGGGTGYSDFGGAISVAGTLSLTGCTLSGNSVATGLSGGAIEAAPGGTVMMADCTLSGNQADFGGGITANTATVTLDRCTLSGNTARAGNGGGFSGQLGSVTFRQCTVAANTATGTAASQGGGIFNTNGALTLIHCTIAGNTVTASTPTTGIARGGGVYYQKDFSIANTIITGNTVTGAVSGGPDLYDGGDVNFAFTGRVFIGDLADSGFTADGNVLTGSALLDILADYGGPTQTMRPQIGSPVLDQADGTAHFGTTVNTSFSTDQRGSPRPQDGDGNGSALSDLGAVERQPGSQTFTVTTSANSGTGSLRTALVDARRSDGADTIIFAPALSGLTITLTGSQTGGQLSVTDTDGVTIDATSLPFGLTISGAVNDTDPNGHRIFGLSVTGGGASLTLKGLTLTGGTGYSSSQNGSGGAILVAGGNTLTLDRCTLSGNKATVNSNGTGGNGGGAIRCSGTLVMTRCTLSGNTCPQAAGGAIWMANGANATLTHCTLSGNAAATVGGGISEGNGSLVLNDCIVAGNTAPSNTNISGTFTGSRNLTSGDPLLGLLGSYGGPTQTMALKPGSPARNAGGYQQAYEVQEVSLYGSLFGTMTLTFNGQTTTGFTMAATAATIQSRLEALSTIGTGNVSVSGVNYVFTVTFAGTLTGNLPTLVGGGAGGAAAGATTLSDGFIVTTDQRDFPFVGTPDIGAYEAGTPGNFYANAVESGTDINADTDGDGNSDLMEYATRGNTNVYNGNPVSLPVTVVLPDTSPAKEFGFAYRPESRDLRYIVKRSFNLGTWMEIYRRDMRTGQITHADGVTSTVVTNPGVVTLTDRNFIAGQTFYILEVDLP